MNNGFRQRTNSHKSSSSFAAPQRSRRSTTFNDHFDAALRSDANGHNHGRDKSDKTMNNGSVRNGSVDVGGGGGESARHRRQPFHSSRRSELAPRLKRRSRRRRGDDGDGNGSSSSSDDGPSLITMLFVAVALASVFNMSTQSGGHGGAGHRRDNHHYYHGGNGQMSPEAYLRSSARYQTVDDGKSHHAVLLNGAPDYGTVRQAPESWTPPQPARPAESKAQFVPGATTTSVASPEEEGGEEKEEGVEQKEEEKMTTENEEEKTTTENEVDTTAETEGEGETAADATTTEEETPATDTSSSSSSKPANSIVLEGYKDNTEPVEAGDQPVFWHIPKAGGSTVKDIMGTCHRFTMASEYGIVEGHGDEAEIAVVRPGGVPVDQDPSPFVNVDPTTLPGIDRAKELGLAESDLADCIVTPYIKESDKLFSPGHRGRLFTVFRHPVDRAVSMFFYIQVADWEPTYNPDLAKMTIEEYAKSPLIENNWMVRQLTQAYEGDLTDEHLEQAKEIIRTKFMVGLLHEKQKTMDRFEKFFGWKYRVNPENQEKCRENLLTSGANSNAANKKEKPKPGDPAYEAVAWQNQFDIKLYELIEQLFVEQEELVKHVPDGFRSMDASCAKCVPPTFPIETHEAVSALINGESVSVVAPGEDAAVATADVAAPAASEGEAAAPVAAAEGETASGAAEGEAAAAAVPAEKPDLGNYKDVTDPWEASDSPVFWHIPKAGGSTVKDIMGTCHRFTMASEYGIVEGHENDPEIAVVRPGGVPVDQDPSPFVNVDPTTLPGIDHAKELGLAESGLADCIVTPYIKESDKLFSPEAQGRFFTVFRHPVDRAVSMFFYIQVADWEPTYNPDLAKMTIEEYAKSPLIENNWMVRQLTSAFEGDLTDEHLEIATDIIRNKFVVGLLHEKRKTMDRFEKFFQWKYRVNPENQEKCRENLLTSGANSNAANKKEKPKPGDPAYEAVAWQNQYDIKLYEVIEQLFVEQEELVKHVPDGFRSMDASCAKCVPPTFPDLPEAVAS